MPRKLLTATGWVGLSEGTPTAPIPTRSAYDVPGGVSAPFLLPLATTATYEAGTDPKTARLRTMNGGAGTVNSAYWSVNFAQASPSDPIITWRRPNGGAAWTNLPWPFRMPPGYQPPLGSPGYTPDGATFIINTDGRYGIDVYRPVKISNTIWETPYAPEVIDFHGSMVNAGARAANISYANGVVHAQWAADALAGNIDVFHHAIAFSIPKEYLKLVPDSGDGEVKYDSEGTPLCVWPANQRDNQANVPYGTNANNAAMGSWWAIPASTDIEALIVSLGFSAKPAGAALLRTLYYRGAVVTDQSKTRAMYAQPGTSNTALTQLDQAWDACINYLCRVTNVTSSTPGGGAYLGDASNRLMALAAPLA